MKPTESRTKIIATLGPATSEKETLKQIILAGVDICRLNFSHNRHSDHLRSILTIREINAELGTHVAILADLQGPKLRVGEIENNGIMLETDSQFSIVNYECIGNAERVYLSYKDFPNDVKSGDVLLVDDGKIKLEVVSTNQTDAVLVKVIYGGILSSRKGVNFPNTKISIPSLTEKDLEDVQFALEHDVDWIALSFVRSATDIVELKQIIRRKKKQTAVIAKIEKPEALNEIDNIIDVSDGIMVARGDLGVEIDFNQVPVIQKEIVSKCIDKSKPVIIATQMMESMMTNFRPTRAEATDVANAVIDGADTLMLSGETSVGQHPVTVIESMHKIIQWTEDHAYKYNRGVMPKELHPTFLSDSICYNATKMADQSDAKAIILFTHSGYTAFKISGYRPKAKIFAFTNNRNLIARMSLLWGVKSFYCEAYNSIDCAVQYTIDELMKAGEIKQNDIVIHVASTPLQLKGRTNMMKISYL